MHQNLAIYDFSQTAPGTSTFSHRISDPVYDYLSVLLQLNPNKPKLEVIFAISEFPSDTDRKCHASLLMIYYLTADQVSLENVLSPFFYNDFKHISSVSEAIKIIDSFGVKVPCIVRLAEPAENPYYVICRDVSIHVKGDLSMAVVVLYAFYQTFNAEYPKCLMSTMRIVGELLGLKHSTLTPQETDLIESLNLA
uniref:DUF4255 domain-containing protein n=1 Tax=Panagrellus redivivus TaxID=6233 RepID=A0A7E4VC00_PANRE